MKKIVLLALSFLIVFALAVGTFWRIFSTINGENTIPQIKSLLGFMTGLGTAAIIALIGYFFVRIFPKTDEGVSFNLAGATVALLLTAVFVGLLGISPSLFVQIILWVFLFSFLPVLNLVKKERVVPILLAESQTLLISWVITIIIAP